MAVRRSKDEIITALKAKVAYHENCIAKLNAQIEAAQAPRTHTPKTSMKKALDVLKESGMTPDEIIALVTKAQGRAKSKTEQPQE